MTAAASLLLLLGSGKPGHFLKTLEQRIAAAAGLLGLSYAACDFFWHFYGGLLYSRLLATAFYVGWKIVAGLFLAMLVCILRPRNMKGLLSISLLFLMAFNGLVILGYWTGRVSAALIFPSLSMGLLIGISVYCGILVRIEHASTNKTRQPADRETTVAARLGQT
jgi:hypothetical protein